MRTIEQIRAQLRTALQEAEQANVKRELAEIEAAHWKHQAQEIREVAAEALAIVAVSRAREQERAK